MKLSTGETLLLALPSVKKAHVIGILDYAALTPWQPEEEEDE